MPGGAPGQSAADIEYTAVYAPADDVTTTNGEYTSTGTDEEAILVDGDITVTVADTKVTRSSEDSTGGDSSSFYGVGAAVLGKGGTTYLKNLTIDTDAKGGAGVFAYGDGVVYVADSVITITGDEEEEKTEFKIDGDNLVFDNAGTTVRLTKTPAEKPAGPAALAPETVDAFDGTWLPKAQLAYGLYGELTEDEKAMVATLKIEAGKVTAVPSFGDPESYDAAFADGKLAFEGESFFIPFKAVITLLDDGTLLNETTMDMGGAEMTVGYILVKEAAAEEPAA